MSSCMWFSLKAPSTWPHCSANTFKLPAQLSPAHPCWDRHNSRKVLTAVKTVVGPVAVPRGKEQAIWIGCHAKCHHFMSHLFRDQKTTVIRNLSFCWHSPELEGLVDSMPQNQCAPCHQSLLKSLCRPLVTLTSLWKGA